MSKEFVIYKIDNFGGGLNVKSDSWVGPGGLLPNEAIEAVNCVFDDGINIKSRGGLTTRTGANNNIPTPTTYRPLFAKLIYSTKLMLFVRMRETADDVGTKDYLVDLNATTSGVTEINTIEYGLLANNVGIEYYNTVFYITSSGSYYGEKGYKWDGTSKTLLGIEDPATNCVGTPVAGAGVAPGVYYYYYSYYNSLTQTESALSPASAAVTVVAGSGNYQVNLTSIDDPSDTQVDYKRLYRQGSGSDVIFRIDPTANSGKGEIADETLIYSDNEGILTTEQDCEYNNVLPQSNDCVLHHNQLFATLGWGSADTLPIGEAFYKTYLYMSRFFLPEAFPSISYVRLKDDIVGIKALGIDLIIYCTHTTYRHRYIGLDESDYIIEEIAPIGCVDRRSIAEIIIGGKKSHIFFGRSFSSRGIYLLDGENVIELSEKIRPWFDKSKTAVTNQIHHYSDSGYSSGAVLDGKYYLSGSATCGYVTIALDLSNFFKGGIESISASIMKWDSVYSSDVMYMGGGESISTNNNPLLWILEKDIGIRYYSANGAVTNDNTVAIAMSYQTGYFGDRNTYKTARSLTFNADTAGDTLTVKIYADYVLKSTQTCSTASMDRVELNLPNTVYGRLFSVRFEISSTSRITISPPLELKCSPWRKY